MNTEQITATAKALWERWRDEPNIEGVMVTLFRESGDERMEAGGTFVHKRDLREKDVVAWMLLPNVEVHPLYCVNVQQAADLLHEVLDLCALGDVDESTEVHGWGDWIKRTKTYLRRLGRG